jgi:hypothetical protein
MKSDLEYLSLALTEWIKANGLHMVIVPANLREIIAIAAKLRKVDADKLEQPTT